MIIKAFIEWPIIVGHAMLKKAKTQGEYVEKVKVWNFCPKWDWKIQKNSEKLNFESESKFRL